MRARFHAEPIVQATELLLQERTPRDVLVARPWAAEAKCVWVWVPVNGAWLISPKYIAEKKYSE